MLIRKINSRLGMTSANRLSEMKIHRAANTAYSKATLAEVRRLSIGKDPGLQVTRRMYYVRGMGATDKSMRRGDCAGSIVEGERDHQVARELPRQHEQSPLPRI